MTTLRALLTTVLTDGTAPLGVTGGRVWDAPTGAVLALAAAAHQALLSGPMDQDVVVEDADPGGAIVRLGHWRAEVSTDG
ncbi:hypothetical protein, partial [Streptomyces sp. NPDC088557]